MLVNKVATTDTPAKTLNTPSQPKLVIIPLKRKIVFTLVLTLSVQRELKLLQGINRVEY